MKKNRYLALIILAFIVFGFETVDAQQELAQEAYTILQKNCSLCHGEHGSFTEDLVLEYTSLIEDGTVIPGNPDASEFYRRLIVDTPEKPQMPWGSPALSAEALATIHQWIAAGAPTWEVQYDVNFITMDVMLTAIENHVESLAPFDRPFARYFTLTHLYNAGESPEALRAYRLALSKLINSLSWGSGVINPEPIDQQETIFYIDLRHYEWDIRNEAWTLIEQEYPYNIDFNPETQASLHKKLAKLREEMGCDEPFVHVDWFLATASLPPLYHDILDLPETDRELERELGVDVARNIATAPGVRVWRAGFNDSGVSNNNRVVERHTSRYGAYWKSYDFAGSSGAQNIFTHPLSFRHDGGEVIFNLPNGLQAYYVSDASGNRIDEAPTDIVSNPAASDPVVRNGLSCIGCHTEGMKTFEDEVRTVVEKGADTATKVQALRLYVTQSVMDELVAEDKAHYKKALEETGGVFGGIEPVHRFYEAFQGPVDAAHAAAAVGMETEAFLEKVRENPSLRGLGLSALESQNGNVQRDAWTSNFDTVISELHSPGDTLTPPDVQVPDYRPGDLVSIPDPNLRAVIEAALSKVPGAVITAAEMAKLENIVADEAGISDLTGLEAATKLERIEFRRNAITDLTPLAGLTRLNNIKLRGNKITDISPLAKLTNVDWLGLEENAITDLSPLKGLVKLNGIGIEGNPVSDVSSLTSLISLEGIDARRTPITDFSALAKLPRLRWIEFGNDRSIAALPSLKGLKSLRRLEINNCNISDLAPLTELPQLEWLELINNLISDLSPLANLKRLEHLNLDANVISDVSPLANLTRLEVLYLENNKISDVSPLAGLTNLERLDLRNNAIADFSSLEGLSEETNIQSEGNISVLFHKGTKIVGPWLWMIASTGERGGANAAASGIDFLAQVSSGAVTELKIATNGTTEGNPVGGRVWTAGTISPTASNNLNAMANATGLGSGDIDNHVAYGSLTLDSPKDQRTTMLVGSDDAVKVWLNGALVHNNPIDRGANDYQDQFPVTLKKGKNILLVAVYERGGGWSGFFGFEVGTEYTVLPPGSKFSFATDTTRFEVGDTFTLHLNTENITDLAGWQADLKFDPEVLKANSVREGSFLRQRGGRTYFRKGTIDNESGRITDLSSARISEGGANGEGRLLSVTFTAKADGESRVELRNFQAGTYTGKVIPAVAPDIIITVGAGAAPTTPAWDVNADGITNVLDLVFVAGELGAASPDPRADVNGDGVANILDLVAVAGHLGESTAAASPAAATIDTSELDPAMIQTWIAQAEVENDGSLVFQQGIANLQRLLAALLPEKTALLANYPNPFNPETWIPYHLAKPADVTVHIYATDGVLVRTLTLGHQAAGIYENRNRAAYWDGKNEVGEPVASGVYFYTLTTGDFTATRKMLIRK